MPGKQESIHILYVGEAGESESALPRSLSGTPCRITTVDTCRRALRQLETGNVSIVLCENTLPDGTWRDILRSVDTARRQPVVIVASHYADESLWAEVLNVGGFDLIAKPFDSRELRHVLDTGRLYAESRV